MDLSRAASRFVCSTLATFPITDFTSWLRAKGRVRLTGFVVGLAAIMLPLFSTGVAIAQTQYIDINAMTNNEESPAQCSGSPVSVTLEAGTYVITPVDRSGQSGYIALSPWRAGFCAGVGADYCWTHEYYYRIGSTLYGRGNGYYSLSQSAAL